MGKHRQDYINTISGLLGAGPEQVIEFGQSLRRAERRKFIKDLKSVERSKAGELARVQDIADVAKQTLEVWEREEPVDPYGTTGTCADALIAAVDVEADQMWEVIHDARRRAAEKGEQVDAPVIHDPQPVYVTAEIGAHIWDSIDTMPPVDRIADLQLPVSGVVCGEGPLHDKISAIAWDIQGDTIRAAHIARVGAFVQVIDLESWTAGEPWGDGGETVCCEYLAALGLWMSTFADVDKVDAPRADRRRAERATGKPPPLITRVKLRKMEQVDTNAGVGAGSKFSHRWIVSGHWRQQPCGPGRVLRRPVLVPPYIKGPADKPLLVKDRVWAVDR